MSECTHDCSTCSQKCGEQKPKFAKLNEQSHVGKLIAVMSGKGGVGKSMVSSLLAAELRRRGHKVGILDADVTGPSIPQAFGLSGNCYGSENGGILPMETADGTKVVSVNLLLRDPTVPVIWRGSMISGTVQQFWTDVEWGDLDYLIVDCPPGTGDVPLTLFQSLPVDGIVFVTSPQELVSLIVGKAVRMAQLMSVPIVGLVENMSYAVCPDCGKKLPIFGISHLDKEAEKYGIPMLTQLPIDSSLATLCDAGDIESYRSEGIATVASAVEAAPKRVIAE